MNKYLHDIESEFRKHANPEVAGGQSAYMRHQFEFFGVKTPQRKEIQKLFFAKDKLPAKPELENIIKELWSKPERELQYFAMELFWKFKKQFEEQDIELMEFMVVNKSWWDTVDMIAGKLMGEYFLKFPERRKEYVDRWLASGNMWLQRSAVLFQLNYKGKTDAELLAYTINSLKGSNEFFINKAIGWALRNYSKTNPAWVIEFAEETKLSGLSSREALRLFKVDY
ncbi:MAG: DNA alkylation repair protein [Chlorobi bacterium]|nr:DNA alkylation repair protein [Chlorobiota bacterium]